MPVLLTAMGKCMYVTGGSRNACCSTTWRAVLRQQVRATHDVSNPLETVVHHTASW